MNKTERQLILPLLIGALPFLMAGLDGLDQGNTLLGTVNLLMAATNLLALRFVRKAPQVTNAIVHLANAGVACLVSYDYFQQGKQGLPYAWVVVALAFFISAIVFYRKAKRLRADPA